MFEWRQHPHSRFNPLTGEWILVSPQRNERPWQGEVEQADTTAALAYDPACYLCPGNQRAGGRRNPNYHDIFAFDNDFPALVPETQPGSWDDRGLLVAEAERGIARVMCFSPAHNLTISRMQPEAIEKVVNAWCDEDEHLSAQEFVKYVQIFENRGQMMGASNPHPHCQIWASGRVPNEVQKEQAAQENWLKSRGQCLLCEYMTLERGGERIVTENNGFVALVPFWAVWPFETMIVGRRHVSGIGELQPAERAQLADILKQITTRYDNLFQSPCPYSMGFHPRPVSGRQHDGWHFHAHFLPPVLRSATVRKFMVGYELLAMPQRDITPETAAERLRSLPSVHHRQQIPQL